MRAAMRMTLRNIPDDGALGAPVCHLDRITGHQRRHCVFEPDVRKVTDVAGCTAWCLAEENGDQRLAPSAFRSGPAGCAAMETFRPAGCSARSCSGRTAFQFNAGLCRLSPTKGETQSKGLAA